MIKVDQNCTSLDIFSHYQVGLGVPPATCDEFLRIQSLVLSITNNGSATRWQAINEMLVHNWANTSDANLK